ncbi:MAG: iron-sulfur cluster repair di-iron protein [Acidobacteria bacterium]|nr:iron-sulfur cluster repair di-iron protein [Acidobacteriota bacterium]
MQITGSTVGQVVRENPGSAVIFEKYGIDYCCGGKRSIADVCGEKGIAPDSLLAEIDSAGTPGGPARNWNEVSLTGLIDHVVGTHHAFLVAELPRLQAMLGKVLAAHQEAHGNSLRPMSEVYSALKSELEAHLWKEENMLFPYVKQLEHALTGNGVVAPPCFGTVRNPVRMMEHEHDEAGAALARLRELSGHYAVPPDACNTYRALLHGLQALESDLHTHIHLENNILFPRAIALESL